MIAPSAAPPARETGGFEGRRRHRHGLAAVEIARPRQAFARLSRARDEASGIDIGAGWRGDGQSWRQEHVGLALAHPDIGSRTYKAIPAAPQARTTTTSSP